MTYQQFIRILGGLGIPPSKYLPDVFQEIFDEWEYSLPEIGKMTGKSVITIRRYCTNGLLKFQRKNPYIVKGVDIKEKLFQEQLPYIKKRLKSISHLHDKIHLLLELLGDEGEK